MITRSKLVEQLRERECQIRTQYKGSALTIFSPKPSISSWADITVAIFWTLAFSVLVISSYLTLYFRHFWLSFLVICLASFVPMHLRSSRAHKRERRMLLPLSM